MNITELKELAEKATPGPWDVRTTNFDPSGFVQGPPVHGMPYKAEILGDDYTGFGGEDAKANDVRFVAAANPAAILELIAKLEDAQGEIRALRATEAGLRDRLAAVEADRAQRVPDGWKLVPVEPTVEMLDAFRAVDESAMGPCFFDAYRAMLAATPAPAQQEQPQRKLSAVDLAKAAAKEQFRHYREVMVNAHQEPPQQERKPMTDEEREQILKKWRGGNWSAGDIMDAVERHHGIKE